jgi:hypothetical protein
MKKQAIAVLGVLLLLPWIGTAQSSFTGLTAEISFPFMAGDKSLPAGNYELRASDSLNTLTVTNVKTKQSSMVMVFTRLSPRAAGEAVLVFDKEGGQHYLSEVYFPGMDGFAFKGATGQHSHEIIKGKK